jgi:hypothetical protein
MLRIYRIYRRDSWYDTIGISLYHVAGTFDSCFYTRKYYLTIYNLYLVLLSLPIYNLTTCDFTTTGYVTTNLLQ